MQYMLYIANISSSMGILPWVVSRVLSVSSSQDRLEHRRHPAHWSEDRRHPAHWSENRRHPAHWSEDRRHPAHWSENRRYPAHWSEDRRHPAQWSEDRRHPAQWSEDRRHPAHWSEQLRSNVPGIIRAIRNCTIGRLLTRIRFTSSVSHACSRGCKPS